MCVLASLSCFYFVFAYLSFPIPGGIKLAWGGIGLWLVAMVTLWMTALTDPGIIPPNPSNARALPPEGEVPIPNPIAVVLADANRPLSDFKNEVLYVYNYYSANYIDLYSILQILTQYTVCVCMIWL